MHWIKVQTASNACFTFLKLVTSQTHPNCSSGICRLICHFRKMCQSWAHPLHVMHRTQVSPGRLFPNGSTQTRHRDSSSDEEFFFLYLPSLSSLCFASFGILDLVAWHFFLDRRFFPLVPAFQLQVPPSQVCR